VTAYYNENDKHMAAWLRELIKRNLIAPGEVDDRSIKEVQPQDLAGFTQCHFFAGIGGWSYALRLAGWPDKRHVWTGSCPCQPYSAAGGKRGNADHRNLWPELLRLIKGCRPVAIFGEQVASAIGHGWLDGISADLEAESYTIGAVVLGAHSVKAPSLRQRLWWVAYAVQSGIPKLVCLPPRTAPTQEKGGATASLDACVGFEEWMDLRNGLGEPGLLASFDGISAPLVRLRGYGNAIVPQVAAEFVKAFMEVGGAA
jgi:DNA (cytosine-5)-methyltransferase 1